MYLLAGISCRGTSSQHGLNEYKEELYIHKKGLISRQSILMKEQINELIKETEIYVIHAIKGYEYQEEYVKSLFAEYNLNFTFVYDGDPSLTNREILKNYFSEEFIDSASVGGMSCTLNHMFAYRKLIESNSRYALVFENDPCFLPNFTKNLNRVYSEIEQLPRGFIISIENTTLTFPSFFQMRKNKVFYRADSGRMAGAYVIDRKGAEKAIEDLQLNKCSDIIDWWHNRLISRNVLDMYWAHPPLVEQGSHNGKMSGSLSAKEKSISRRLRWLARKYYRLYILRIINERRVIEK